MRKVVLYIAMSLDGYIADENGGVDWLLGDGSDKNNQGSYVEFIKTIDTVILGYKTYRQIATELFPDTWIYAGKKSYVITHNKLESSNEIIFTEKSPIDLINDLARKDGKDIWICGGAAVVNQLLAADLIDRFYVNVIPVIIGGGVSLFFGVKRQMKLKLVSTQAYNGIVDLVYERRC